MPGDQCPICLDDFDNDVKFLPCSHKLHTVCFENHVRNGGTQCPVCRNNLNNSTQITSSSTSNNTNSTSNTRSSTNTRSQSQQQKGCPETLKFHRHVKSHHRQILWIVIVVVWLVSGCFVLTT